MCGYLCLWACRMGRCFECGGRGMRAGLGARRAICSSSCRWVVCSVCWLVWRALLVKLQVGCAGWSCVNVSAVLDELIRCCVAGTSMQVMEGSGTNSVLSAGGMHVIWLSEHACCRLQHGPMQCAATEKRGIFLLSVMSPVMRRCI